MTMPDTTPPTEVEVELILDAEKRITGDIEDASAFRICSLDVNGNHRNLVINREYWRNRTHKQRWLDDCGDAFAFTPEELIPEEPNAAFLEFCRECKITLSGHIGDFPAGRR